MVEDLYRSHAEELTAALALTLNDRASAEDLVHETFLLAMQRQDELQHHPNARAWLFRTGYNLARNRWRLLLRRRHAVALQHPVLEQHEWESVIDLRESLRRLSPRQREAVILYYYLDFSVSDISEMLGCSAGSVKTYLSRGRDALDRMLRPGEASQ